MAWIRLAVLSVITLSGALFLLFQFGNVRIRELEAQVDNLEKEKTRLVEYARRLSESRRVAQLAVISQTPAGDGVTSTTLRWQEIGDGAVLGQPVTCTIRGMQVYVEALVLKFEPSHVGEGDAQRGASLALFRRLFGEAQPASSGVLLDATARPPTVANAEVSAFRERLWSLFWDFVDDPLLAQQYGVRVAQVEAPSAPVRPGQTWQVTLDALGGLNLIKLSEQRPVTP